MKKISILLMTFTLFVFSFHAQALTHMITVQDFSFNPSSMTVTVGDTVTWMWVNGTHTTTSTSVPGGALTWDQPINSTSASFTYVVMAAGTYNYTCTVHPTLMSGSFTATVSSGISSVSNGDALMVNSAVVSNQLYISFTLQQPSSPDVFIFDLAGNQEYHFTSSLRAPGSYEATYNLGNLAKGMYFLELRAGDVKMTRKIVIE